MKLATINSGALWGLLTVTLILVVTMKIRKRKAERRWEKYGEDKIYRPEEWEAKQGAAGKSESDIARLPKTDSGASTIPEPGSDERQKVVPTKSNSISKSNIRRNKKSNKANKQSSVTVPSVEPIKE